MVRLWHVLVILLLFGKGNIPAAAQESISLGEVRQAGLYVVEITTVDGEEPRGIEVVKPGTSDNINMVSANKVGCRIVITLAADTLYNSGDYDKDKAGATIRINGNTSALYSHPLNMPYKLKLERKADLLIRGDAKRFEDKNWRLLKDATSLNTIVGMKANQLAGMEYTPAFVPCNVVINGDYRGCYLLVETVRRNPRCRIDCDKLTGYIVERDPYWWKEEQWFSSLWYDGESMYRWTWKYPDEDTVSSERHDYIQDFIVRAEQSLDTGDYEKYIDISSFARWLMVHDILGTRDSGGANMYVKKYDDSDTTRLQLPCVWDFDSSYDLTPGTFSRLHTSKNAYFSRLFDNVNKAFASFYVTLWNQQARALADSLTTFLNQYPTSSEGIALDKSRKMHNRRWQTASATVGADALATLQWLQSHVGKLTANVQQIDIGENGMISLGPSATPRDGCEQHFTLDGRKTIHPARGSIVVERHVHNGVVGGKKFIAQ